MIYINSMNLGSMWNNNLKNSNKKFSNNNNNNRKLIFNNIQNSKVVVKNNKNAKINTKIRPDTRAYWGNPTWILFHTIAEKINNNYYINNC